MMWAVKIDEEAIRALLKRCVHKSASLDDAREVEDLAVHAATEALKTAERIANSANKRSVATGALLLSMVALASMGRQIIEDAREHQHAGG